MALYFFKKQKNQTHKQKKPLNIQNHNQQQLRKHFKAIWYVFINKNIYY